MTPPKCFHCGGKLKKLNSTNSIGTLYAHADTGQQHAPEADRLGGPTYIGHVAEPVSGFSANERRQAQPIRGTVFNDRRQGPPSVREAQDAAGVIGDSEVHRITGGRGLGGASAAELQQVVKRASRRR